MRVVLDTNVLVSALLFRGRLGLISDAIQRGTIIPCFTAATFQEFEYVLQYPRFEKQFKKEGTQIAEVIRIVATHSMIFPDPKVVPRIVKDTPDNFVLAAAIAANARYIVTGDADLLQLKEYSGILIITPAKYMALI